MIEALGIKSEAVGIYEAGSEYLTDLLDILFVTLIKHLPVMTKEQMGMINKLDRIVGGRGQRAKSRERGVESEDGRPEAEGSYMVMGDRMVKIVGEIDDSDFKH